MEDINLSGVLINWFTFWFTFFWLGISRPVPTFVLYVKMCVVLVQINLILIISMLILKNISDLEKNYPAAHLCLNMFPLPPYLHSISLMREARPFECHLFKKIQTPLLNMKFILQCFHVKLFKIILIFMHFNNLLLLLQTLD